MSTRAFVVAVALLAAASAADAYDYKVGNLEIDRPWSRATPKGAKIAGGYVKITNTGSAPDRLVGGTFGPSRAVEIHEMSVDRGVMKMRELKGGLDIAPGATVELKPGGLHLMFTDLPVRSPRASASRAPWRSRKPERWTSSTRSRQSAARRPRAATPAIDGAPPARPPYGSAKGSGLSGSVVVLNTFSVIEISP